jgi:hypothetical protein
MDEELSRKVNEVIHGRQRIPVDEAIRRLKPIAVDPDVQKFFRSAAGHNAGETRRMSGVADIPQWVDQHLRWKESPIYELEEEAPELDLGGGSLPESERGFAGPALRRRSDSGLWTVRIALNSRRDFEGAQASFLQRIRDAAQSLDQRQLVATERPYSSVVISTARSRLPEHELPVLGPGGRLTVYSVSGALEVDVTIRKRRKLIASHGRGPDEIASHISRQISMLGGNLVIASVEGLLGYFELSKYDRQRYLRPAFVLVVSFRSPNDDSSVLWRSTVVEPATTAPGLSLGEGLGSWIIG